MRQPLNVFVLVLGGKERDALAFAQQRYPLHEVVVLSKAELRESGWKNQLRRLHQLKGKALLLFIDSLESLTEPMLLRWTALLHQCGETVIADASGSFEVIGKKRILTLLPQTLMAVLADASVFALTWIGLRIFRVWLRLAPEPEARASALDLAFIYPSQGGLNLPGGASTHVTGFLSGLAQEGARIAVISGHRLSSVRHVYVIPGSRFFHLFRESASLLYNLRFIRPARYLLKRTPPRLLYQRHGRFLFAGAVLSRLLGIPLVLEYNASEMVMAKHWDPARFPRLLGLCERVSIEAASLLVVVSKPLKKELMEGGVPAERILVNPNAVDADWFHPGCGGVRRRQELGLQPADTVVCFVGTFSYWHGVAVLERAIASLLIQRETAGGALKFILVGDGLLAAQMRSALEVYVQRKLVIFTGAVSHQVVREYLDAADILVSPHVPMPGGVPFFGSPTKLFEYMAMGKPIAASALDQIAEVLEHGKTALLVEPGDPGELAAAIRRLAADPQLRRDLGMHARQAALSRHTWRQNASRVLAYFDKTRPSLQEPLCRVSVSGPLVNSQDNLAHQDLQ
jgi:glycosyltransferase involved in cell wall biosynthesis